MKKNKEQLISKYRLLRKKLSKLKLEQLKIIEDIIIQLIIEKEENNNV